MPLWHIYCPAEAYTAADKEAFADAISELYVTYGQLPKFYVSVVFHEVPAGALFIGGKPHDQFVRIWMDHIALRMPPEYFGPWMGIVTRAIAPWVRDRGFDWEIHGDETPLEFWSIQGMKPPPAGSDEEKRWARDGIASAAPARGQ
jgi:phenylpyruvate tautomerase PptA (4-oxalocrotonate tautomerase family)